MGSAATSTECKGTQTDGKHHVASTLIISSLNASKKNLVTPKKEKKLDMLTFYDEEDNP